MADLPPQGPQFQPSELELAQQQSEAAEKNLHELHAIMGVEYRVVDNYLNSAMESLEKEA